MLGLLAALQPEAEACPGYSNWRPLPSSPLPMYAAPDAGALLAVSGMGPDCAAAAVRLLARSNVKSIILFGTCGGLDSDLRPGDLVLASRVADQEGQTVVQAPPGLLSRVRLAMDDAGVAYRIGAMAAAGEPVRTPQDKAGLFAASGALGVDMESAGAGLAAEEEGLELLVLKAVVDPADCAVAEEMPNLVDDAGRVQPLALTRAMIKRPSLGPELAAMGRRFGKAKKNLNAALSAILKVI